MRPVVASSILLGALVACAPLPAADAQNCPKIVGNESLNQELMTAASKSKLLIMMRHTEKGDQTPRRCVQNDQALTPEGRRQAGRMKILIEKSKFGEPHVISSDYCRTLQTAEIIFDAERNSISVDAQLGIALCNTERISSVVSTAKRQNRNIVLVTHSNCLEKFVPIDFSADEYLGVSLAFDITGSGEPDVIGCIWREDWSGVKF